MNGWINRFSLILIPKALDCALFKKLSKPSKPLPPGYPWTGAPGELKAGVLPVPPG